MRLYTLSGVLIPAALVFLGGTLQGQEKSTIRDIPPRAVADSEDPVNRLAAASTVDGLVVVVTIDGSSIHLDNATPARIRRASAVRPDTASGDWVTAVGFAGGIRISEVSVPDGVLNAQEGVGIVRLTKRQVVLALPAPRALDTVEISAPATSATARLDVRSAYAAYCRADNPDPKVCPPR